MITNLDIEVFSWLPFLLHGCLWTKRLGAPERAQSPETPRSPYTGSQKVGTWIKEN